MTKVKKTRKELKREIKELRSQNASVYHFSTQTIDKASIETLTGSAIILELSFLGGRLVIEPTCIRDGLSEDTIECLKKDINRSYELATQFKP